MRILVVEDEPAIAEFIASGLRSEGYAVTCAGDGQAGEIEAVTGDYSLVLLDVLLPTKSGLEVLDAIRVRKADLPVNLFAGGIADQNLLPIGQAALVGPVVLMTSDQLAERVDVQEPKALPIVQTPVLVDALQQITRIQVDRLLERGNLFRCQLLAG